MADMRACILSVAGATLTAAETKLLAEVNPFGVIFMGRSCKDPQQVRALSESIWDATGHQTLIFIDQEGGRVRRLRPPVWPDFPAPLTYSSLYKQDREAGIEAVWLHHRLMAAELEPMGIRADCAPVVDLLHSGMHQIVGDRAFGDTPEQVGALALAALDGLSAGGVAGVIKHMPGHGRAEVDSHESMPVVRVGRDAVEQDIAPFRTVRHASMGMTAHLAYAALDDEKTPATHSGKIISQIIRKEIGFDGLLMTDDLGMQALGGTLASRASRAIDAGCDVILHCSGFIKEASAILDEMAEVAGASPVLAGDSLRRAKAAENAARTPIPFDKAAARAKLQKLLSRAAGSSSAVA
ncbi:MAG: beta-N-acetylhexosaminidase [Hyphomonadaceae bacterium]|nr:beta-N-acetylhexosaminidase [Hyphomonadaceae bacterium]